MYAYAGYPVFLFLLGFVKRKQRHKDSAFEPTVSLVIAAYNEAANIGEKLENSLALNYPAEKLEILVVSDCSTDETDQIVENFRHTGIMLHRMPLRGGKTVAQNDAVQQCNNEIIIFSDANAIYHPDAVRKIVQNFADHRVGCVCGELKYVNDMESIVGQEENLYWKYEKTLKRLEDSVGTILGANGSIYAIRKELYVPLPPDTISDLIEPLKIVYNGSQLVYEPEAISVEATCESFKDEFRRKKRIVLRSLHSLFKNRSLLNVFRFPMLAFQLISHKIIRWFVPVILSGVFLGNLFLISKPFYLIVFILQCVFYLLALIGYRLMTKNTRCRVLYIPLYFCMVNLASLIAIIRFFQGKSVAFWQPARNVCSQQHEIS
ncbi:glycosyltransferase family 2 protein [candidate division KSB1 bacterium]|nr:glycosyltransferase family 2 protein [candidate division KSB1 bacterium]